MSVRRDSARPSKNKFPKMKKRNKTKKQVKKSKQNLSTIPFLHVILSML